MRENQNQALYRLIREYMNTVGTSRTTVVALKSYISAIQRVRCNVGAFKTLVLDLNSVIKHTQPKLVSLLHLIESFESEMQDRFGGNIDEIKRIAVEILSRKLKAFEEDTEKLTQHCTSCIEDGDFIIVHSPTAYIRNALVRAHVELKRNFNILILKQDFFRTKDLVNALRVKNVAHLLIPEHNLSHYLNAATKLFISAVTISADRKAVTGPGTANVVSICHANHLPVFLFAESIKFSHMPLSDQHIFREQNQEVEADFSFQVTAFSHDFVDLQMIDHVITETGEIKLN